MQKYLVGVGLAAMVLAGAVALPVLAVGGAQAVAQVKGYKEVGSYDFAYMLIPVYHAVLLAPGGTYDPKGAYALQLTYRLSLQGVAIANRGLAEMKKQGYSVAERAAWKPVLVQMMPNVASGESLTAIRTSDGGMVMEKGTVAGGGTVAGSTSDAKLAQAFFDIWLGAKTTSPAQRAALTGSN